MSYPLLKEQLKNNTLSPCFHFFGEEQYLKNHYIGSLKEKLVEPAMEAFNFTVLEGSVSADSIITAVSTPPMLSEKKLIVLKETGIFTAGANGKAQLTELFEDFPPYAHLIAVEEKTDKRSAVYKAFSKIGLSVEFAYRSRADLRAWVLKILKSRGKTMKAQTLDAFLEASGVDMYGILSHLEKLIAHAALRPEISLQDVETLLVRAVMTKEYVLTDALLAQNTPAAMAALEDLWEMQTDPMRILTVIASNYLSVTRARALLDDKIPYPAIVEALHLPVAFLAKKTVEAAGKTSMEKLERAVSAIRETDYKMKLGLVDAKTGITLLCATLLQKNIR